MPDNILIGPDAQSRFTLQMLRAYEGAGKIGRGNQAVTDGVFFSTDPEARVTGRFRSDATNMIEVQMEAAEGRRWQALHVRLGDLNLSNAGVLGVVARSVAPSSITTRLCLRSGNDDQFMDTFLPKTMVSFAQPSTHMDAIEIAAMPDLPRHAQWRDLILFFRAGDVSLDLLDLRLFVV